MRALDIYAGPLARAHLAQHGLNPRDIGAIPAAAGASGARVHWGVAHGNGVSE